MSLKSIRTRLSPLIAFSTVVAVSVALQGCSSAPATRSANDARPQRPSTHLPQKGQAGKSSIDDPEVRDIQLAYRRGQFRIVIDRVKSYERRRPQSPYLATLFNLQGLSYLSEKNMLFSAVAFQKAIRNASNPASVPYLQYNLANAQFQGQQYDEAFQTISEVRNDTVDTDTRTKLALLKSKIYRKKDLPADGIRELMEALKDGKSQPAIERELRLAIVDLKSNDIAESILIDYPKSPGTDIILFQLATADLKNKNKAAADVRLKRIIDDFPESELADRARAELSDETLVQRDNAPAINLATNPSAIGVLLPLSGKFSQYGQNAAQSIVSAFQLYESSKANPTFELYFEDSKETEDDAIQALDRLVNDHQVIAVIGPLTSKGIEKVAEKAASYGVPLLSLAQKEVQGAPTYFPFGLTPQKQAEALVEHAVDKLKIKSFAILSPKGKFGDEYSQAFWDAVERKGAKIVGYETYSDDETDFRQYVDKLSGLFYTGARTREFEELAQLRVRDKIKKRNRRTESYFAIKPIIDYQAVFIPDEAKVVGQILPTFGYRDVENVLFLGPSTWRSSELLNRVARSAEGAILSDAFFENSNDPQIIKFVDRYQASFGRVPGVIDAIAFDAAAFLKRVLDSGSSSRSDLIRQIHDTSTFNGVTGQIKLHEGTLERNLKLITVKANQFIEVTENSADWHP